ncbi:hypothetical protein H0H81_000349 [Sphagnurus paluster]|uniref:Uncharacterized protein n=1 Tax=Sphagnurus paluster TaxID=117069 RepID=A0A9P7GGK4_9AGAR|nr:hypothetical protein H0H81_000349 [Sphagnurus paluster]
MSSEESQTQFVSSGKDDFKVSQLVAALKESKGLVHTHVHESLSLGAHEDVATEADWGQFWATINKIDAPVTQLVEDPEEKGVLRAVSPGTAIGAVSLAITVAQTLYSVFSGWDDKSSDEKDAERRAMLQGRSQWTQDLVRDAYRHNPQFNYVVVCIKHSTKFNGIRDRDWSAQTFHYKLKIGSITYTLYAFRSGVFSLQGGGGYLNWAFIGRVVSQDPPTKKPRSVVFRDA